MSGSPVRRRQGKTGIGATLRVVPGAGVVESLGPMRAGEVELPGGLGEPGKLRVCGEGVRPVHAQPGPLRIGASHGRERLNQLQEPAEAFAVAVEPLAGCVVRPIVKGERRGAGEVERGGGGNVGIRDPQLHGDQSQSELNLVQHHGLGADIAQGLREVFETRGNPRGGELDRKRGGVPPLQSAELREGGTPGPCCEYPLAVRNERHAGGPEQGLGRRQRYADYVMPAGLQGPRQRGHGIDVPGQVDTYERDFHADDAIVILPPVLEERRVGVSSLATQAAAVRHHIRSPEAGRYRIPIPDPCP